MDITERYVASFVIECITGKSGGEPEYYKLIKGVRKKLVNPLLQEVVGIVKTTGQPAAARTEVINLVRKTMDKEIT